MGATEDRHLELFHRLDFEGWNGADWDLFSSLHTDDVVVEAMGQRTEGIAPHVHAAQQTIEAYPALKVAAHPIQIAQGEWTAVIGELANGARMVTVARWRGDAIAEEYVFMPQG